MLREQLVLGEFLGEQLALSFELEQLLAASMIIKKFRWGRHYQ